MRILFCGDRDWTDVKKINSRLYWYNPTADIIVHGAARGADTISDILAKAQGFEVDPFPADWTKYKKAAGPIRNKEMLDSGIDQVEAFHNDIHNSKGTKDMIEIALAAGVPVNLNGEKLSGIV